MHSYIPLESFYSVNRHEDCSFPRFYEIKRNLGRDFTTGCYVCVRM